MQISRLFEIVYILLSRRRVTAKELAGRFEVSVRTIYRDIDALSQAGVPVYATQGAGGGIYISDAYVLNKSALTDEEQGQILVALQSLSITGGYRADALLSRLGSLFDKKSADWIEIDFTRWGNRESDQRTLTTLKDAILGRRVIAFRYFGGDGANSRRSVSPLKLIYKTHAWYVQAFCHLRQDFRTFKIVRMTDIAWTGETFDRDALPTPPPLEQAAVPEPQFEPVTLRFDRRAAWRAWDEFDPREAELMEDGAIVVRAHLPQDDWLIGYLMSFGTMVEVLEPPALRRRLVREMLSVLARYGEL